MILYSDEKGAPEDGIGDVGEPEGADMRQLAHVVQAQVLATEVTCQRHCADRTSLCQMKP